VHVRGWESAKVYYADLKYEVIIYRNTWALVWFKIQPFEATDSRVTWVVMNCIGSLS